MEQALISIVIPFYNEADQVALTLAAVTEVMETSAFRYELVCVDDGSGDESWVKLREAAEKKEEIRLVRFSRNFGKEAAICAGLDAALGDAVVVMDGDLQHPPRYIPDMIRLWQEGYEVVEGVKESRGRESVFSRLFASLFYRIFRRMSGLELANASDFKLLDRKVVEEWKRLGEKDTFFRALSAWMGFRRIALPFTVDERPTGKSKWGFGKLFRLSVSALTGFSSRPLMLISSLGTFFLLVFFILAIQTLIHYFKGQAATGFTTVILLQLFIGSIILISLGLIGLYLDRLFREVKGRPRYLIQETFQQERHDLD